MTTELLVDAFDGIDSRFILSAAARIEAGELIPFRRRRALRTVLIAAAITALLAATAYAAGLFGLTARRITPELPEETPAVRTEADAETMEKVRETHRHSYVSLGGVTDSPEYSAAAEWLSWRAAHEEEMAAAQLQKGETYYEWRDLERGFAETDEEREIARLYGCWDRASLDRLRDIAEAHGLKLHTQRSRSFIDDQRYTCDYENGSHVREGRMDYEGWARYFIVYTELPGYLPADELTTSTSDEFEEWSRTTARGDEVSIALLEKIHYENGRSEFIVLIFRNGEDAAVTVSSRYDCQTEDLAARQTYAEALADYVDFESYAKGEQP